MQKWWFQTAAKVIQTKFKRVRKRKEEKRGGKNMKQQKCGNRKCKRGKTNKACSRELVVD